MEELVRLTGFLNVWSGKRQFPFPTDDLGLDSELPYEEQRQERESLQQAEKPIPRELRTQYELYQEYIAGLRRFALQVADPPAIVRLIKELGDPVETIGDALVQLEALHLKSEAEVTPDSRVARDSARDARDEWFYKQCQRGVSYKAIILGQRRKPKTWPRVGTPNGIKKAANSYARSHSKPEIERRQRGRPAKK